MRAGGGLLLVSLPEPQGFHPGWSVRRLLYSEVRKLLWRARMFLETATSYGSLDYPICSEVMFLAGIDSLMQADAIREVARRTSCTRRI